MIQLFETDFDRADFDRADFDRAGSIETDSDRNRLSKRFFRSERLRNDRSIVSYEPTSDFIGSGTGLVGTSKTQPIGRYNLINFDVVLGCVAKFEGGLAAILFSSDAAPHWLKIVY